MSRIVAALVESGLVRSEVSGRDRRRRRLEATARGIAVLREGRKRRVESLARALRGLRPDQRERLEEAAGMIEELSRRV